MPRDLFDQTLVTRSGPKRSKWTIAGSILAHAGFVCVLLIAPVLSALDDFVAVADSLKYVHLPAPMPAMPAAPPRAPSPATPTLNRNAAPLTAATRPVTQEPPDFRGNVNDLLQPPGLPPGSGDSGLIPGLRSGPPGPPAPRPTPVPAEPQTPRRAGGDIRIPGRIYYVEPIYPTIARETRTEGMVILEATIDESGIVRNVRVLRSHALLDQAAIDAVSKWKYTPTKLNGVAIPILLTVTVNFALR
jgi:protein TonB